MDGRGPNKRVAPMLPFDVEAVADAYAKLAELARAGVAIPLDVEISMVTRDEIEMVVTVRAVRANDDPTDRPRLSDEMLAIGVGLRGRRR